MASGSRIPFPVARVAGTRLSSLGIRQWIPEGTWVLVVVVVDLETGSWDIRQWFQPGTLVLVVVVEVEEGIGS